MDEGLLRRKLERARAEIAGLESLIENKTRSLFLAQQKERELARHLEDVMRAMTSAVIVIGTDGRVLSCNEATGKLLGTPTERFVGAAFTDLIDLGAAGRGEVGDLVVDHVEVSLVRADGERVPVLFSGSRMADEQGDTSAFVCVAADMTEKRQLEVQLRQAQKLEAIGQLAAGIAHEINTPTQYVGDNLRFLANGFESLSPLLEQLRTLTSLALPEDVRSALQEVDVEYLAEEIPASIRQSLEGIDRVAKIVRAMKEFSHPGGGEMTAIDLNSAIESTVAVASHEWKYVADVETDLDPALPPVPCIPGEFNQVVLNIIVNAAHAIADGVGDGSQGKGTISISTRRDGDSVEMRIADTGTGIPQDARGRIFDPFFTTKEVGRGTGQGLAIAHGVIVQKHGGTLDFETEIGRGTAFIVRLPLERTDDGAPKAGHAVA